jgi:S-DNA-T family DNA segregation ATPase FtsK/SpoIIIE
MTYSIHTLVNPAGPLQAEKESAPRTGWVRFAQEFGLFVAGVGLVLCFLSLLSHNLQDPAWSSSGTDTQVRNWVGRLGAWTADIAYFLFGFSACGVWLPVPALGWWPWPFGCVVNPRRQQRRFSSHAAGWRSGSAC